MEDVVRGWQEVRFKKKKIDLKIFVLLLMFSTIHRDGAIKNDRCTNIAPLPPIMGKGGGTSFNAYNPDNCCMYMYNIFM